MKTATKYIADDGKEFDTAEECKAYEEKEELKSLCGLTVHEILNTLSGSKPELAAAFERIGRQCAANRIASGGAKRARKGKGAEAEPKKPPTQP